MQIEVKKDVLILTIDSDSWYKTIIKAQFRLTGKLSVYIECWSKDEEAKRPYSHYLNNFEVPRPISFGNWGLVGFIFNRLIKTDQYEMPEIEEVYNKWFTSRNLISNMDF